MTIFNKKREERESEKRKRPSLFLFSLSLSSCLGDSSDDDNVGKEDKRKGSLNSRDDDNL